jgi:hypothetical protein
MGLRRLSAVLLLLVALGLVALGLLLDAQAAVVALGGAVLVAVVLFVDVDALKSRG